MEMWEFLQRAVEILMASGILIGGVSVLFEFLS